MDSQAIIALIVILAIAAVLVLGGVQARRPALARISATGGSIVVEPLALMKLLALRGRIVVPAAHVRTALPVNRPQDQFRPGLRLPGTSLPGLLLAGSFRGRGERSFWVVGRGETAVRIDLADEAYDYVVVDVADPAAALREINQARRPLG